jgi:phospholipase/carboxylesterase
MQWEKFEDLNFIAKTQDGANTAVILFHGYGADATDLYSLSQVYKLQSKADWFFPQGVLEVPIGPMMSGRAWFSLTQRDFENLTNQEIYDGGIAPKDEKLAQKVSRFLNQMGKNYENVIIGGFSQGAILTSHSFYRLNFSPKGLLLFSGYLVNPSAFPTVPEALQVPFFQSHGSRDQVLPVGGAKKLHDKLKNLGLKGRWFEFGGAHEIPMDVIAESQIFVNSL